MSALRFIVGMLGCAALSAVLVAGFNVAVDPYLVFDRYRTPGFNALKPAVETHEPMMKSYQASRVSAKTVIVGSSRSDIGLDPASAAWPAAMRPVYNLSIVGSGLATNLQYLRSLVPSRDASEQLRTLIVGLDFESFLYLPTATARAATTAKPAGGPDEQGERLAALEVTRNQALPPLRVLKDYATAALTLDALLDSVSTMVANRAVGGPNLDASGRLSEGRLRQWTQSDGAALLFTQKNELTLRNYLKPKLVLSDTEEEPIRDFAELDALIDLARRHKLTVVLAVQPAHASRLELLDGMGYWPDFERWKRGLAKFAESARAEGVDVTVWDFGGYELFIGEPVPASGDRQSVMKWFWDPVHYSTLLGDLMIAAMTGANSSFPDLARLTPQNVELRLAQVRRDRDDYRRRDPGQLVEIRRLLCVAGRCKGPEPAS
jgi:hypothetical protein